MNSNMILHFKETKTLHRREIVGNNIFSKSQHFFNFHQQLCYVWKLKSLLDGFVLVVCTDFSQQWAHKQTMMQSLQTCVTRAQTFLSGYGWVRKSAGFDLGIMRSRISKDDSKNLYNLAANRPLGCRRPRRVNKTKIVKYLSLM